MIRLALFFCFIAFPAFAAVEFDGVNDNIGAGNVKTPVTGITIYAAFRSSATTNRQDERLLIKSISGSPPYFSYAMGFCCADNMRVSFNINIDNVLKGADSGTNLSANTDYTAIGTWNNGGGLNLYINGALDIVGTGGTGSINYSDAFNTIIGDGNFGGTIYEIAIWDVGLTAAEVQQIHKSRLSGMPLQVRAGNLVRYWKLDDFPDGASMSGTNTVKDCSVNKGHATPSGSPVSRGQSYLSYSE